MRGEPQFPEGVFTNSQIFTVPDLPRIPLPYVELAERVVACYNGSVRKCRIIGTAWHSARTLLKHERHPGVFHNSKRKVTVL